MKLFTGVAIATLILAPGVWAQDGEVGETVQTTQQDTAQEGDTRPGELRRDRREIRHDRRQIHRDRRELRQDRRELRRDWKEGDRKEFKEDLGELREDRGELREDRKELREDKAERREDRKEWKEDHPKKAKKIKKQDHMPPGHAPAYGRRGTRPPSARGHGPKGR